MLVITQNDGPVAQVTVLGDVLVFVATVAFSCYTVLEKRVADRYDNLMLNVFLFGLGRLLMLPLATRSVVAGKWIDVHAEAWRGLAFRAIFGSVIAYAPYAFALSELAAPKVGSFTYLQTVVIAVLAVLSAGEHLTGVKIVDEVLVLSGMYVAGRRTARQTHRSAHSGS